MYFSYLIVFWLSRVVNTLLVEQGNTLSVTHASGFAVYKISSESVSPVYVGTTKRAAYAP